MRPAIEKHLRKLAAQELPPRVMELAALGGGIIAVSGFEIMLPRFALNRFVHPAAFMHAEETNTQC